MPQNQDLSLPWRQALGEDWQRVHETWLHTLGNLTLTGYNSEYSDRPFSQKRDMEGGFNQSPLRLNKGLGRLVKWDANTIQDRALDLAAASFEIWSFPSVPKEIVDDFQRRTGSEPRSETHEDHEYLSLGRPARILFDGLRQRILDLDDLVYQESRMRYISYKAETNFVDIAAQSRQLKIWLNLPFHVLNDPKGIARDVTNVGHLGVGDVEIKYDNANDLPYVMSLIRQSFERQMDDIGAWV